MEAIKNTGSPEQSGLAKNIQEMRETAKQKGISTEQIDKIAKDTLSKPQNEQFNRGKFPALKPSENLGDQPKESIKLNDSEAVSKSIESGWQIKGTDFPPIKMEVRPDAKYRLKPDDTYESIAKKQLGPDASESELKTYMQEIHRINGCTGEPTPFRSPTTEFLKTTWSQCEWRSHFTRV